MPTAAEFKRHIAERNATERRAVGGFLKAVRTEETMSVAFNHLSRLIERGGLERALIQIPGVPVCEAFKRQFLSTWVVDNGWFPNGSRIFITALRHLLPRYDGPGLTLFRGQWVQSLQDGFYGLSWTTDEDIGRQFAQQAARCHSEHHEPGEGGVLLRTEAPAGAIICAPALNVDLGNDVENEYIVDPRFLTAVHVIERFPEVPYSRDDVAA